MAGSGLRYSTSVYPEGLSKTMKNLRISGIPTEIQTRHLLNAGQKRYH
jgi:hypothetical protein